MYRLALVKSPTAGAVQSGMGINVPGSMTECVTHYYYLNLATDLVTSNRPCY